MIRFSSLAVGVMAYALWAGVALADTPPTAPAPAVAAPVQSDPERLALARQIYDVVGTANMQSMTKTMIASMQAATTKAVSGPVRERQEAMMDAVSDVISELMPKAVDATVVAMADNFTVDQLKDILAFYQSPTGKAMFQKMPVIMSQSMRVIAAEMPDVMKSIEQRYCAKVTCMPSEREAFAKLSQQMHPPA